MLIKCEETDSVTLKVIVKLSKVRFGSLSHIYVYKSVVSKCCPKSIVSCGFSGVILMPLPKLNGVN